MIRKLHKQILSLIVSAVLAFSGCIAVSATDISTDESTDLQSIATADEVVDYTIYGFTELPDPMRMDEELELQVVDDYLKIVNVNGNNYVPDQIIVDYYGKLESGALLVYVEHEGATFTGEIEYLPIHDRIYVYEAGKDVKIYKDNSFYSIKELLKNGELSKADEMRISWALSLQMLCNGDKTKSDISTFFRSLPVGDNYDPITSEPFYEACKKAHEILDDENATTEEITEAYYELEDTFYHLKLANWDEAELTLLYSYARVILEDFREYYDDEIMDTLSDLNGDAQLELLYAQSQESIDQATEALAPVVQNLEPTIDNPDILSYNEYLEVLEHTDSYFAELLKDKRHKDYSYAYPVFLDFNGYRLIKAYNDYEYMDDSSERIDGYLFVRSIIFTPSEYGVLAVNTTTDEVFTLEEAIEKGVVDLKELYDYVALNYFSFDMYIIGDTDFDDDIDVSDATYLQKSLIGLSYRHDQNLETDTPYDFNGDGVVNIMDATEIQKYLV